MLCRWRWSPGPAKNADMGKVVKAREHCDKAWDALNKFPSSENGKSDWAKICPTKMLALVFIGSQAVTVLLAALLKLAHHAIGHRPDEAGHGRPRAGWRRRPDGRGA